MGIEKEILEQGFNWLAIIISIIIFGILFFNIKKQFERENRLERESLDFTTSVGVLFVFPSVVSIAAYFILDYIS